MNKEEKINVKQIRKSLKKSPKELVKSQNVTRKEERGMGIVEGYLFGKLVGEINTNVEFLREKLRKISSLEKLDEISRAVYLVESEEILEREVDFIKEVYSRKNALENQFKESENIGMRRTIASELDRVIKDYEQVRKELCYFVTDKKPWGQE